MKRKSQTSVRKKRPWSITALGLLLFLQALILAGITALLSTAQQLVWMWTLPIIGVELQASLIIAIVAGLLAAQALLTAPLFLRIRRRAWLYAVLIQGLTLLVTLVIYLGHAIEYIGKRGAYSFLLYFIMLYAIFMVVYLNYAEVRDTFAWREPEPRGRAR